MISLKFWININIIIIFHITVYLDPFKPRSFVGKTNTNQ